MVRFVIYTLHVVVHYTPILPQDPYFGDAPPSLSVPSINTIYSPSLIWRRISSNTLVLPTLRRPSTLLSEESYIGIGARADMDGSKSRSYWPNQLYLQATFIDSFPPLVNTSLPYNTIKHVIYHGLRGLWWSWWVHFAVILLGLGPPSDGVSPKTLHYSSDFWAHVRT